MTFFGSKSWPSATDVFSADTLSKYKYNEKDDLLCDFFYNLIGHNETKLLEEAFCMMTKPTVQVLVRELLFKHYLSILIRPNILKLFLDVDTSIVEAHIDIDGNTLLHSAVLYWDDLPDSVGFEVAQMLLEHGGLNVLNDSDLTALQLAVDAKPEKSRSGMDRIICQMIDMGADILCRYPGDHATILHRSLLRGTASTGMIRCLTRRREEWKILTKSRDKHQNTPSHVLQWTTDPEVVRTVIRGSLRLNTINDMCETFFHKIVAAYDPSLPDDLRMVSSFLDALLVRPKISIDISNSRYKTARSLLQRSRLAQFPQIKRLLQRRVTRGRRTHSISSHLSCFDRIDLSWIEADDAMVILDDVREDGKIHWVYHSDTISRLYHIDTVLTSPMTRRVCVLGAQKLKDVVNQKDYTRYKKLYSASLEADEDEYPVFGSFQNKHTMTLRPR